MRTIAFPGQYFGTVKNSGGYTEAQARMTTLTTAYGGISESSVLLSANPSGSWYGAYAVIHDDSFAVTMESNVIETTRKVLVETKTEGSDSYMALTNGAWTYRGPGNDDYWGTEELPWAGRRPDGGLQRGSEGRLAGRRHPVPGDGGAGRSARMR